MPSFLVSVPFPRISPLLSLTMIMAVVLRWFSCIFFSLLALTFQNVEHFLPFLSLKAFHSSLLLAWFHAPYAAFARGCLFWPSFDFSTFTFYCIFSFHLDNSHTTCFKMLDFTPFCFYLNPEWIRHQIFKKLICCIPGDLFSPFHPCQLKHDMLLTLVQFCF